MQLLCDRRGLDVFSHRSRLSQPIPCPCFRPALPQHLTSRTDYHIVPTCSDVILLLPTGYFMFSWKLEHFELLNHHLLNLQSLFIRGFKCTVRSKPFYGALPAEMKYQLLYILKNCRFVGQKSLEIPAGNQRAVSHFLWLGAPLVPDSLETKLINQPIKFRSDLNPKCHHSRPASPTITTAKSQTLGK